MLFADTDPNAISWQALLGTAVTAVVTLLGGLGSIAKLFLDHVKQEASYQREHEANMVKQQHDAAAEMAAQYQQIAEKIAKLFLDHVKQEASYQREHEADMVKQQHDAAAEMAAQYQQIAEKFDATVKETREDQKQSTRMILDIQKTTIETMDKLGQEVRELGTAVQELRRSLDTDTSTDRPVPPTGRPTTPRDRYDRP